MDLESILRRLLTTVDAALDGKRATAADMSPSAQVAWIERCLPEATGDPPDLSE